VEDGGKLTLDDGRVIQANFKSSGGSGRLKLGLTDWDEDGLPDLLIGTMCDNSVPSAKAGLPMTVERASMVLLMRNVGSDDAPVFQPPEFLLNPRTGGPKYFGVHSCSPAAADMNGDGKKDLLVGEEAGRIHLYDHHDVHWGKADWAQFSVAQCRWYKGAPDDRWHSGINWQRGLPRPEDQAIISKEAVVRLHGQPAQCQDLILDDGSVLEVMNGDCLEVSGRLMVGPYSSQASVLKVNGGTVDVPGRLMVGQRKDSVGNVVLTGGVLSVGGLELGEGLNGSGEIRINGGVLRLIGSQTDLLGKYIEKGLIASEDPAAEFLIETESGWTVLKIQEN
jgi:hypothetical protein